MRLRSSGGAAFVALIGWLSLAAGSALGAQETDTPAAEAPPGMIVPNPGDFEASVPFEDPELEATVRMLARELRCPTCQALSIEDSPSELSQQMKEVIRDRLREGMTPEEVRQHFVAAYGEWILLSPTPTGFNLLVYVLPFVALLIGTAVVIVGMRRWMGAGAPEGSTSGSAPPTT